MTMCVKEAQSPVQSWLAANEAYLEAHMRRLRLLLHRRVLWLRRQWQHDPLQSYRGLVVSDGQADRLLAGENRHAEASFYQEDHEAAQVSRSIAQIEHDLAAHTRTLTHAGSPPAMEVLADLFRLTPFERNVLLLCLATDLDLSFEQLYAYVQDDVNRKHATPRLALTLFAGEVEDPRTAWEAFLPEAPLRRFHLVTLETGTMPAALAARPLGIDERISHYLRGVNRLDERVAELVRPMQPTLLASSHRELVVSLARSLESGERQRPWPVVNLIGAPGSGRRSVARALCNRLGLQLYRLDAERLPGSGTERQLTLRLLEREALLLQLAFYLDAPEPHDPDKAAAASFDDTIERLGIFLVVGSLERWQTGRELLPVRVPKPDVSAQRSLWRQALDDVMPSLEGHIDSILQQFDFGPKAIAQAVAAAKGRATMRSPGDGAGLTADDLWQACREQAGGDLGHLGQRIISCYTWQDIVLPKDVFRQLQEIVAQVANRPQVYERWGFGARLSRGGGISALFAGPSGTGKTMATEIMANHLKLDLYRIDLAGVVSKYIGETEKNLRKVFDAAEQSGAILFFDEADALFGKRTEVKDSHDRYANIEVSYLLQRMEDYRGLAILATNRKSALDEAFLRRLRFLVDFPFPDADSRRRIWQKVFPAEAPLEQLDYAALARLEIPGGNIRNISLNAAFLAASEPASIGMPHVMHAVRREYAKINKLITEAEFGPFYQGARG